MNHYAFECDIGTPARPRWHLMGVWACDPREFRYLIDHIGYIHGLHRGGWEYIRLRRIPEFCGPANWNFQLVPKLLDLGDDS